MKTLIIGPSWVGDMMMSQSLYRILKTIQPDREIHVMAPAWCLPLLARMPEVSNAIPMPLGHGALAIKDRYQLGVNLRKEDYQHAIVLPNSFKSALVPFFARIPLRTGWRGEMRYGLLNDLRVLDKSEFPLMVQRYAALAYDKSMIKKATDILHPLPWPKLLVDKPEVAQTLKQFNINSDRPLIGFCPGAEFGPAKRWPHYHYASLAQKLIENNHQVILLGSAKDNETGEAILQSLSNELKPYCCNITGKTSLEQAVALIAGCAAIVSNDSGLMHIAAALERPLIALYGPSSPYFTPPLCHYVKVIRLIMGYHKIRKGDAQDGYHQSLIDIQPEHVFGELNHLLSEVNSK